MIIAMLHEKNIVGKIEFIRSVQILHGTTINNIFFFFFFFLNLLNTYRNCLPLKRISVHIHVKEASQRNAEIFVCVVVWLFLLFGFPGHIKIYNLVKLFILQNVEASCFKHIKITGHSSL